MDTIVGFRFLVLDSLKYSSKAESPINRSTEAVISKNLTTSQHNHFFSIFFLFSIIFYFFILFLYIYIKENRHYRLICIAIAIVDIGWLGLNE